MTPEQDGRGAREERCGTDGEDGADGDTEFAHAGEEGELVGEHRGRGEEQRDARREQRGGAAAHTRECDSDEHAATEDRTQSADDERWERAVEQFLRSTGRAPEDSTSEDEERSASSGRRVGPLGPVATCAQKVALSPQAQEPDEFGFSMENPEASRDSFQSITAPER